MEVHVRVNESHVNRVREEQLATIELDADRDTVLNGAVKDVAPYPYPLRWHGAPLEYGTIITIKNPPKSLRPGLRAKVKIFFESKPDVLQVPLAAVIEYQERFFCLVRENDTWRTQAVTVGSNNNKDVIVESGLEEGDRVALTPFRYIKRSDLADQVPTAMAAEAKPARKAQIKADCTKVSAGTPEPGSPAS